VGWFARARAAPGEQFNIVSVATCWYTRDDEVQDFERQFEAHATRVIESFRDICDHQMAAVDTMSSSITSHALASGTTFPNVILPNYEVLGVNTRILADAGMVLYMLLVSNEDKTRFEAYARDMERHFDEEVPSENELARGRQDEAFGITVPLVTDFPPGRPEIWVYGPHNTFPSQTEPVYAHLASLTCLLRVQRCSFVRFEFNYSRERTEKAVLNEIIAKIYNPNDTEGKGKEQFSLFLQLGQYREERQAYGGDPTRYMGYPMFSDFGKKRELVGLLLTTIYFRNYITVILPPGADGIYVVLESDAKAENQIITCRIDGPNVTYLGVGDLHGTTVWWNEDKRLSWTR
jgi:hypothetical protein